ncbi:SAM-dependent methyltransferase [Polymorphobacter multimanifer]|uniref:SAM-dependent methyltransferase n=1 Tax=Polymorphobacter multimanifer TaxID=1070431 RepID=A0A841LA11_9SPHN|nr:class I SAM-dependent methyltransferase [Polymorphobacter multimanifer]MBB6225992.1 SAM-dependent methyltransferase [Polymorphobacter multimanifer]
MAAGWDASAAAWIAHIGSEGDFGRVHILDAPMLARVRGRGFRTGLDVGCGEGRFCRMLAAEGIAMTGVDPVAALVKQAQALHPEGRYIAAPAETMVVDAGGFDLVVSYLSLIDMPDLDAGVARMVAALRPGGTLLIANLNSFNTAGMPASWRTSPTGERYFAIDHYLQERDVPAVWNGIDVVNHHRPMMRYMQAFLGHGLQLVHFDEPAPGGGPAEKADRYRRVPYFHIMEWQRPA